MSAPTADPRATMLASLEAAGRLVTALRGRAELLERIAALLLETLRAGRTILTCGNGGSSAEALHLAEEMLGRYQPSPDRPGLAAISLCADACAITCIANDFGFEEIFARQVTALGRPGDTLVALSTSGRSPNILRALERARAAGLRTVGLLGPAHSPAEPLCDLALTLDDLPSARVQEGHLIAIHLFLDYIDRAVAAAARPINRRE
ncbi:MAG: SIS domain-containing protein [Phycisphaerae bacterium]